LVGCGQKPLWFNERGYFLFFWHAVGQHGLINCLGQGGVIDGILSHTFYLKTLKLSGVKSTLVTTGQFYSTPFLHWICNISQYLMKYTHTLCFSFLYHIYIEVLCNPNLKIISEIFYSASRGF
jgi:hypothetical protein